MSLLKTNEIQNYNGTTLTLTASTVSTSAQLNTGGNISVTGSLNVSDDSTTRTNLGLGTIATQDSNNVSITGGTLGSSVDLKAAINASGSAPVYAARAWVNFDGTDAFSPNPSASAIRGSGNVSSINQDATGTYTINFTTAMPDANYAVTGMVSNTTDDWQLDSTAATRGPIGIFQNGTTQPSSGSCRVQTRYGSTSTSNGNDLDFSQVTVAFFR